jgi:hypothetical protein
LQDALTRLDHAAERLSSADAEVIIGDLTFDEAKELARRVEDKTDAEEIARAIESAGAAATIRQSDQDSGNDWKIRIAAEETRIRVRGYEF